MGSGVIAPRRSDIAHLHLSWRPSARVFLADARSVLLGTAAAAAIGAAVTAWRLLALAFEIGFRISCEWTSARSRPSRPSGAQAQRRFACRPRSGTGPARTR